MTLVRDTTRRKHEYFAETLKDLVPDLPLGALAALAGGKGGLSIMCGHQIQKFGCVAHPASIAE
jgi:hypothetical protein